MYEDPGEDHGSDSASDVQYHQVWRGNLPREKMIGEISDHDIPSFYFPWTVSISLSPFQTLQFPPALSSSDHLQWMSLLGSVGGYRRSNSAGDSLTVGLLGGIEEVRKYWFLRLYPITNSQRFKFKFKHLNCTGFRTEIPTFCHGGLYDDELLHASPSIHRSIREEAVEASGAKMGGLRLL